MNTYKICLIKNRYTGTININKYVVDWFKTYANLNITIDTISTDFDVTTLKISNNAWSGVVVGADILPKIRTVIPENKYNAVIFLYGNDLDGIRLNSVNIDGTQPLYADTEFINTWKGNDEGKIINHELFHCFFFKAKKLQFNVVDNMDTYIKDNDLSVDNVIDTNREVALQRLAPYWTKICAFRTQTTQPPVQTMQKWKYFKLTEFTNIQKTHTVAELDTKLVDILDKMREECGFPFKITSGYRTVTENSITINAVKDSAHTKRLAVDIKLPNPSKRLKMIEVGLKYGIIGFGLGDTFTHLDIDTTNSKRIWLY